MEKEFAGRMEFTYQFEEHTPRVVVTLSPQSDLDDVFEAFEGFLLAAGYVFKGQIDVVSDDVPQDMTAELS